MLLSFLFLLIIGIAEDHTHHIEWILNICINCGGYVKGDHSKAVSAKRLQLCVICYFIYFFCKAIALGFWI